VSGGRARGGFALPSAIFLLVVLAALGAFLLRISMSQQIGAALDVQGARAFQAARAGIEWGLFQSLRNDSCGSTTLSFGGTGMAGFSTTVGCARTTANELGTTVTVDQITATACNQPPCPNASPGTSYVERQLSAKVSR
jgi:MSHA biogenesis protein MshP